MRRLLCIPILLLFCFLLCVPVSALTFVDNFDELRDNSIQSYRNLIPLSMDGAAWSALPDLTAFTFADKVNPVAFADYRMQNARQITVGVYSLNGTCVTRTSDEDYPPYILGVMGPGPVKPESNLGQAKLDPLQKTIYAAIDGQWHRCCNDEYINLYPFQPVSETPGALSGYGVNVYASADGENYRQVAITQSAVRFAASYPRCYEEYTGRLPEGALYLRVELNDVTRFPGLEEGEWVQKGPTRFNALASVEIYGEELVAGLPLPVEPEIPLVSEESGEEESEEESSRVRYRGAGQDRDLSAAAAASEASGRRTASRASDSSRTAVSKFEGVIEIPATAATPRTTGKAPSAASSRVSPQPEREQPLEQPVAQTAAAEIPRTGAEDDIIYDIAGENDDNNYFTAMITVYIIGIVSATLVYVLLSGRGVKKRAGGEHGSGDDASSVGSGKPADRLS